MVSTPSRRPFELIANHIVLDFINTVNARPTFTRDDLSCAEDIADWAKAAGLVRRGQLPSHQPAPVSQFRAAVALRERLYQVFGPIAFAQTPQPAALASITRRAAEAMRSAEWHRRGGSYELTWRLDSIESLCDRLADDAVQLLRSPAVGRIGSCDGCGWLFLDTSRAHGRRWCSMNACGVRHKMRRYHQRQAAATGAR